MFENFTAKQVKVGETIIHLVQGMAFDCGHFLPGEAGERTANALIRFLS